MGIHGTSGGRSAARHRRVSPATSNRPANHTAAAATSCKHVHPQHSAGCTAAPTVRQILPPRYILAVLPSSSGNSISGAVVG